MVLNPQEFRRTKSEEQPVLLPVLLRVVTKHSLECRSFRIRLEVILGKPGEWIQLVYSGDYVSARASLPRFSSSMADRYVYLLKSSKAKSITTTSIISWKETWGRGVWMKSLRRVSAPKTLPRFPHTTSRLQRLSRGVTKTHG